MAVVDLKFHRVFAERFAALADAATRSDELLELFGDIQSLLNSLEELGHGVEDDNHVPEAISHPIVTSRYQTFALRRTPPTSATPMAFGPPVLRIPYVWFDDRSGGEPVAVVMLIGDKTTLGNDWYPTIVQLIDNTLIPEWVRRHPTHEPRRRR